MITRLHIHKRTSMHASSMCFGSPENPILNAILPVSGTAHTLDATLLLDCIKCVCCARNWRDSVQCWFPRNSVARTCSFTLCPGQIWGFGITKAQSARLFFGTIRSVMILRTHGALCTKKNPVHILGLLAVRTEPSSQSCLHPYKAVILHNVHRCESHMLS